MTIRPLRSDELALAVPLLAELGYPLSVDAFSERFAAVTLAGGTALVGEEAEAVVGLIAFHSFEMLHRPGRLGRIDLLVVAKVARRRGIGKRLVRAAEEQLRAEGSVCFEVTSAEQRRDAHAFYVSQEYAEKRVRFFKWSKD